MTCRDRIRRTYERDMVEWAANASKRRPSGVHPWSGGQIDVISSTILFSELEEVPQRPKPRQGFTLDETNAYIELFQTHATVLDDPLNEA